MRAGPREILAMKDFQEWKVERPIDKRLLEVEERARFQVRDLGIVCAVAGVVTFERI